MSAQIIKKLVGAEGGQAAFGRRIGAAPALVWQWVEGKRPVSPRFVLKIEEEGLSSRHDLRPDVFGPAPKRKRAA